jgi:hypothetical protein
MQLARVNIGSQHTAGVVLLVLLDCLCIRPNLGLPLPRHRLARCGGRRAAFVVVAFVFDEGVGINLVLPPALLECGQSGMSGLRRLKACGLQVKEWLLKGGLFALLGVGDTGLSALTGGV